MLFTIIQYAIPTNMFNGQFANFRRLQVLSLQVLESKGWTNKFFSLWFSSIDSFTRVHDKKLSIAAIVALLTLNADQVPISVQQGWPRLLQGIVRLFQTLPAATKSELPQIPLSVAEMWTNPTEDREEALKDDFPLEDSAYDDEEEEDEWAGDDTTWNEETEPDDETDGKDEQTAYLEFLNEEAQKFQNLDDNDSDDELGEESLLETPLDRIEPYQLFRDVLLSKRPSL